MKQNSWSASRRLPLMSGLTIFIIVLLISGIGAYKQSLMLQKNAEDFAQSASRILASSFSDPLARLDIARISRLISANRYSANHPEILVFNERGRILTTGVYEEPRRHRRVRPELLRVLQPGAEHHPITWREGAHIVTATPILSGHSVMGGLEFRTSTTEIQQESLELFLKQGIFAFALGLTLGLAAWWSLRRAFLPLNQLVRSIDGLTGTGTIIALPRTGPIEIQRVSESFSRLLSQLRDTTLSREVLSGILEGIGEGLLVLREDGIIEDTNRVLVEMSGRERNSLKGIPLGDILIGEEPEKIQTLIQRSLNDIRETIHHQSRIRSPLSNEGIPVLLSFRAANKVGGMGFIITCLVQDIREIKKVEEMKSRFLASVSHDLRTPLTSIKGTLGLMAGGAVGALPPKAHRLVDIASESTERMLKLINDLLDLEKAAEGKLQLRMTRVELSSILERARDLAQGLTIARKLRIEVGISARVPVEADPDRLHQVLMNLLSNACKYAPENSNIDVRLLRQSGRARVEVRDQGPGVPAAFQKRLFERFAQAGDGGGGSSIKGSGLGLALVRELIEGMGGQVGYQDRPGGGACFWFELPPAA